jgi:HD-GYP domain-containing protein (c-di-GMP phosphodiesterase class II)
MHQSRWSAALRRVVPVAAIAGPAALVPLLVYIACAGVDVDLPPIVHFIGVSAAGALAGAAAVALSVIAVRLNDGRAVLLGFGFSVMAVMLVLHALATPGVLIGDNGLVQAAGALNIPFGGAILAATALPALRRPRGARNLLRVQLAVLAALVLIGTAGLVVPGLIPVIPRYETTEAELVFVVGAAMLTVLAYRAGRTFLLTRRMSDLLVTVGVVFLAGAEFGLLNFDMMDLGWWAAHVIEVAGIGLVGIPAALDLRHSSASRPLVGDLRPPELVADEEAFLGGRVHALMLRLAEKDHSTEGHTRRVAMLAVQIGERLGLRADRLRLLALGGLLHDMGKLSVPDAVLNKPGKLTDDEFAVIRRHPAWGRELLNEIGGFPPLVLELVESHHERLDGHGYPNQAEAGKLDLEVRILTVADVYDALTADRVYREAWPADRALALLDEDTGSAFDAACVGALRAVVAPGADAPSWRTSLSARLEASGEPLRAPTPRSA